MWLLSEVQQGGCGYGCCAVPLLCRALPHTYLCTLTEGGVGAALEFRIKFYETILFMSSTIVCSPIHDARFLSLQLYLAFFFVMQLHLNSDVTLEVDLFRTQLFFLPIVIHICSSIHSHIFTVQDIKSVLSN